MTSKMRWKDVRRIPSKLKIKPKGYAFTIKKLPSEIGWQLLRLFRAYILLIEM
ncbi:hypothetical protein SAMN05444487_104170 [Marininema mesophilum]|uniref:Uncharacterized protein n=1 Tax=Marininema mesophilum TaxID=1048340 RepID=A0A1H2UP28_9BACL|nr:hypothetical protein SAMN05444487_104170 [Marininema mesophilum]